MSVFKRSDTPWSKMSKQDPGQNPTTRDVYNDQQIGRSDLDKMQTMTSRLIFVWLAAIGVAFFIWFLWSAAEYVVSVATGGASVPIVTSVESDPVDVVSDNVWNDLPYADDGSGTSKGADLYGNTGPSASGYVVTQGMTYEEFRECYFYTPPADGSWIKFWYNRVTGKQVWEEDISALYHEIRGANGSEAYRQLYGEDAEFSDSNFVQPVDTPTVDPEYDGQNGGQNQNTGNSNPGGISPSGHDTDVPVRKSVTMGSCMVHVTLGKLFWSLFAGTITWFVVYMIMKKNLDAQNVLSNVEELNQYKNDQHIALPEEVQRMFDWFPDVGAHSPVQVSSMISHMALENKGLAPVQVTRRADKDIRDADGHVIYLKGEVLLGEDGRPIMDTKPMIDEKFSEALFDASSVPKNSKKQQFRIRYDTTAIEYNPGGKNRGKLKDAETVADMINKYWTFPQYEPQRPSGAYIVDTEPVNTIKFPYGVIIA